MDGASHILVGDMGSGSMLRVKLATSAVEVLYEKQGKIDGIVWDHFGRLFFTAVKEHTLYAVAKPGAKPEKLTDAFQSANDIRLGPKGDTILVADMGAGTLYSVAVTTPGAEVDQSPLPLTTELAFPKLKWTGWDPEGDDGKPNSFRPIVLTHNGDAKKVFVASQHGVIYSFDNDQNATETKVFADLRDRVVYNDKQNEEGFLGFAFHPKFAQNGEVFVFYTTSKAKLTNIVSRFRVKKDDPTKLDPDSEEQLLVYKKPYWNHDGGTIAFGPDHYLYIVHGDGGAGNDPHENAQNLNVLLGKILRIDVDKKSEGKPYAIPADNPFVGKKDALPEIYAYGFRNVWRMAFDPKTGVLWAADVGQNLWEEIDLIERGGNYGWNRREGRHPFGAKGSGLRDDFIEPIWEYHHDIGKSLTGGTVYRGSRLPELDGKYLYADYISNKIWARLRRRQTSRHGESPDQGSRLAVSFVRPRRRRRGLFPDALDRRQRHSPVRQAESRITPDDDRRVAIKARSLDHRPGNGLFRLPRGYVENGGNYGIISCRHRLGTSHESHRTLKVATRSPRNPRLTCGLSRSPESSHKCKVANPCVVGNTFG
ncbi:MAG: PQQ-dependent sugar dehydrogenase [Pirellulales bacterium]